MRTMLSILLAAFLVGGAGAWAGSKASGAWDEASMDCTFTIKGEFNGTVVDLVVTVTDVSFLECAALKLGVKRALR